MHMRPLPSVEDPVRSTSDSQEQRRLVSSSLNDSLSSPDLQLPLSSSSPTGCAASLPPADEPILIFSLPDTPSSVTPAVAAAADISHLGLGLPEAGTEGKSPVTTEARQPFPRSSSPALVEEVPPGCRLVLPLSSNSWKKKSRALRCQLRRGQIKSPTKGHGDLAGEGGSGNDLFEKYRYQPRESPKSTTGDPSAHVEFVPEPINPSAFIQNPPSSERKASKPADREDGMQSKCRYQLQEVQEGTTGSPKATASVVPGPGKSPAVVQNPPLEVGVAASASVSCGENPPPPSVPSPVASSVTEPQLSLLDIIKMFSKEPDMKYANTDLLEIMEMKGIEILSPQWWGSVGYDDMKHSISELGKGLDELS